MKSEPANRQLETGFEAFNGLIGDAVKHLDRLKAKGMGDYGLSGTHTLCMRQMYHSPNGLTRTELAKRCGVDRAQITRVIGDLLTKELALEIGSGSNYRKRCVLTDKGREITADINDRVSQILTFVSGSIPPDRLSVFYETLRQICQNLENAEDIL